jgi:hypothetical protein
MQSHALTRVNVSCDAVVLIKMDFCAFLFPFILIMQSTYTRVRCQCDAVVLIKMDFVCFSFSIYFNLQSPPLHG